VARNIELLQCLAHDFFRSTIAVHVGGIPSIQTAIISRFEKVQSLSMYGWYWSYLMGEMSYLFFSNDPRKNPLIAKAHASKYWNRNSQARLAQIAIFAFGCLEGGFELRGEIVGRHSDA
jgi:hypothetical protein